jgi:2-C-methyl-D-erythritol 4-phosphate cytidylyltransferase
MPKLATIIPAAGQSTRFAGPQKKPFLSLDGKPLWQRACELFWNRPDTLKTILVLSAEDREEFRGRFGHLLMFANCEVVDGGAERFESVANALAKVPEECELVAIHDAVRPLVSNFQADAVIQTAAKTGAAMLAMPVADTLKKVDSQIVVGTVPREGLWQAQTPQVFRRDWLVEGYARRGELGTAITDDAQLIEALGHKVSIVTGSAFNFKITTKDDLNLADAVMKSRKPAGGPPKAKAVFFDDEPKWD